MPFDQIAKYYRKTDTFFPTHRETQGMVAQEIVACGGLTTLQPCTYPKSTLAQFAHIIYNQNDKIDFGLIRESLRQIHLIEFENIRLKAATLIILRTNYIKKLLIY